MRVMRSPVRWVSKNAISLYCILLNRLRRRLKITFWESFSRKMTIIYRRPSRPSLTTSITARMESRGSGLPATMTSSIRRRDRAGFTSSKRQVKAQTHKAMTWRRRKGASMFFHSQANCLRIDTPICVCKQTLLKTEKWRLKT